MIKNLSWAAGSVIVSVVLAFLLFGTHALTAGSISSPATNMDYLVLSQALGFGDTGGNPKVNITAARTALVANSTIPCAIQNPLNATSTILSFAFNVAVGTSTSENIVVGTSTSATATSSGMVSQTIGSGALATITWDPPINSGVIGPSQWILGSTNGTGAVTYTGSCSAVFVSDI